MLHSMIIQAYLWESLGQESRALEALVHCLQLAQYEGYVMIFLDEGEPIYRLLKALQSHPIPQPLADYAFRLIQAFEE